MAICLSVCLPVCLSIHGLTTRFLRDCRYPRMSLDITNHNMIQGVIINFNIHYKYNSSAINIHALELSIGLAILAPPSADIWNSQVDFGYFLGFNQPMNEVFIHMILGPICTHPHHCHAYQHIFDIYQVVLQFCFFGMMLIYLCWL